MSNAMATYAARAAAAITPHDSTNFSPCRAIYVGTGGTVVAVFENDAAITFINVPSGAILPVRLKRVNNTSTTASSMVALY